MKCISFLLFIFIGINGFSQFIPEYNMTDSLVYDCKGFLFDSGGEEDIYLNNEDFTFTIETEGIIEISFLNQFCVENELDALYVHDGPTTASPLVATLWGTNLPPSITINSGIVTFHFTSDQSAAYCGWEIYWTTEVTEPIPPIITIPDPGCNSNAINVEFSYPQLCSLLEEGEITFDGEVNSVTSIIPTCMDENATQLTLTLDEELDFNCDYSMNFHLGIPDQCDSIWYFDIASSFSVTSCPVNATIIALSDSICLGSSTELTLEVPASDCQLYTYAWNNGLPSTLGPHTVNPITTTTYTCLVTEVATGQISNESFTLVVVDFEISTEDIFICESSGDITLEAETPNGLWSGTGIIDEIAGIFNPDEAEVGQNTIYYTVGPCTDSMSVFITPIDAGGTEAACPGTDPFQLTPSPAGGTWSGDFVTPTGIFDPSTVGSYTLTYTLNQCTDILIMNVEDLSVSTDLGEVCQSVPESQLSFTPYGGSWSGEGIVGANGGYYDPGEMSEGPHQFLYEIYGCNQIVTIDILPIYVGSHWQNNCPDEAPFIPSPDFSPVGGTWSGIGIADAITGLYDPSLLSDDQWTDLLYSAPNGCTDTIYMYNKYTELGFDSLFFCADAEEMLFNYETVGRNPWGGDWSGGVFNYIEFEDEEDDDLEGWYFYPATTGIGDHTIIYANNGCSDSLVAVVYPLEISPDSVQFCSTADIQVFGNGLPSGATWSGEGITDPSNGTFDPSLPIEEDFFIYWSNPAGCIDSIFVHIEEYLQAEISGLDSVFCFEDNNFFIEAFPDDGIFSGSVTGNSLNPSLLGEGEHTIIYTYQGELCASADTFNLSVNPELILSLSASDELICPNASSVLTINTLGGLPDGFLEYNWSEDSFLSLPENTAIPLTTTTYSVEVNDGCSDPVSDSILITVLPPIQVSVTMNETVCYGEPGFATATVLTPGEYETTWGFNSEFDVDTLFTEAGNSALFTAIDTIEECEFDTTLYIPSFSPIVALFTVNPNEECIPYILNEVTFIDLSENGLTGYWDFGNGDLQTYDPNVNPVVTFESNTYTIQLNIENEGGCPDSSQVEICILPSSRIFIPDIFSPNNDGSNDSLYVRGQGIETFDFRIYDQYGRNVYQSDDQDEGWDGKSLGLNSPSGIYIYTVDILLKNGEFVELKGDVTLIR